MANEVGMHRTDSRRIFLCHSSGDKAAVRELHRHLIADGFNPWLDEEDLVPGVNWEREITEAVRSSAVVLVCLSRNAVTKAGFVQKEITFALDRAAEQPEGAIFMVPVRLEECEVPHRLNKWQWVDLFEERGYLRILKAFAKKGLLPNAATSPNVNTIRPLRTLKSHTYAVHAVAVSEDERLAVSASEDHMLKVWEVASGLELRTLAGHTGAVLGVALSGNGRVAVSASDDKTLKVWDVESGRALRNLKGHASSVVGVALSGDGRLAVSASRDDTLKVWEVATGRELHTLSGHSTSVTGVAVTRDGRLAVSASLDRTLKVWELATGRELRTLTNTTWVYGVAVTRDGRLAISASEDQTLKVWELGSGQELRTLSGHTGYVRGVALSGSGRLAISSSYDQTLKVWNLETGIALATFTCDDMAFCCAFVNDRDLIAGDYGGRIYFLRFEETEPKT